MRLKLDHSTYALVSTVEKISGAQVKDIFKEQDILYIIVKNGHLGKAIGKKGITAKKIQLQLKQQVKILEFSGDPEIFIKNLIYPVVVDSIELSNDVLNLKCSLKKAKSLLMGRNGGNLLVLNRALKRFYPSLNINIE